MNSEWSEFFYSAMSRLLKKALKVVFILDGFSVLRESYSFSSADFVRKKSFHWFRNFLPEICWGMFSYALFLLRVSYS